jgi:hypothetical protein
MRALPSTPAALLEELFVIFPEYRAAYDGPIHDGTPTFHSVLMAFTPFFGGQAASFSERQLRAFGQLVNDAVAASGSLENAFDKLSERNVFVAKLPRTVSDSKLMIWMISKDIFRHATIRFNTLFKNQLTGPRIPTQQERPERNPEGS